VPEEIIPCPEFCFGGKVHKAGQHFRTVAL
jgi:hypothetical protein